MAGIPSVRRKGLLMADGDEKVHHAVLEYRWREAVPPGLTAVAERDGVVPALVELTVDGQSWLIELSALEWLTKGLRESQEYFAGVKD